MIECGSGCLAFIERLVPSERLGGFMDKCSKFGDILYETNKTFNLTRIPESEFWCKHVCDSLAIAAELKLDGKKICDAGCGAGFPSVILASAFPDLLVTAVDSTRKKVDFVSSAADAAGLPNLTAIHARANELARKEDFAFAYDAVTARAVSDCFTITNECAGFLRKRTGELWVYRTPEQMEGELSELGHRHIPFRRTREFELPDAAGTRLFLVIRPPERRK